MEGRELPVGWVTYCLAEIGGTKGGKTPSKSRPDFWEPGTINWTSPKDMKAFVLNASEDKISHLATTEGGIEILPPCSVLMVTRSGILAHTFPIAISSSETSINQDIKAVRPLDGLNERFLAYSLKSLERIILQTCSKEGTTVASVETKLLEGLPLPLAPLNEQRRIAAKLDTTLAAVDACRQRLDGVAAILKRFRQAVLAAATAGELTRGWREENSIDEPWTHVNLSSIADSRLGKMLDKSKNTGNPTPYLRNINVRWFTFDLSDIQSIRISDSEKQELDIRYGDLLVCEGGEPGRCAVWRGPDSQYTFQKALHRIRTTSRLSADYLAYCLRNSAENNTLSRLFTGTTIKHLTGRSLAQYSIPLPSRKEQDEIVNQVEALFTLAVHLESRLNTACKLVDRLTPALLAKAFRGELVPQDPNDEPASKLLAKLKAKQSNSATISPRWRAKQATRRQIMNISDKDSIKAVILSLKINRFTFDELREQVGTDYESLKGILFELLEEPSPVIRQVFDQAAKAMKLERIGP